MSRIPCSPFELLQPTRSPFFLNDRQRILRNQRRIFRGKKRNWSSPNISDIYNRPPRTILLARWAHATEIWECNCMRNYAQVTWMSSKRYTSAQKACSSICQKMETRFLSNFSLLQKSIINRLYLTFSMLTKSDKRTEPSVGEHILKAVLKKSPPAFARNLEVCELAPVVSRRSPSRACSLHFLRVLAVAWSAHQKNGGLFSVVDTVKVC